MRTPWPFGHTVKYTEPDQGKQLHTPPPSQEYEFLRNNPVTHAAFDYAAKLSKAWNSPLHEVLLCLGWMSETDYCRALSARFKILFVPDPENLNLQLPNRKAPVDILPEPAIGVVTGLKGEQIVINSRAITPRQLSEIIANARRSNHAIAITTQQGLRAAHRKNRSGQTLSRAVNHLANHAPTLSSSTGLWPSQALTIAMLFGLLAGALAISPRPTLIFIMALLTMPFLIIVIIRLASLAVLFFRNPDLPPAEPAPHGEPPPDARLPVYSVLVPLFKESEILPDLVEALKMLDYPATKLDIKIILESVDVETIEIAQSLNLPGNFDIIIVPDGAPRTKPRALNYALEYAKGEYAVIYDAEDEPEPDQLRRALAMFRASPPDVVCIQARLNIYNRQQSWLARQFTIEYTALFDGLLPAFESLSLPILLGGTSNHFRGLM